MIPVDQARAIHIWTVASGSFGCSVVVLDSGQWLQLAWPSSYSEDAWQLGRESITLKELVPNVLA